ncbi:MAG TPA: PD-(D/E)XK nuclease family protein [Verrucomicrobiae bacterium]|nr:PD-(D/E)XK nuclease family protein [Verrucomicrobiae bacterium]
MQIVLGPFHPYLEEALVEEILHLKKGEPLAPILLLVPSNSLRRRLKVFLARERGLNFLNLHILTFFQLSRRLLEERFGSEAPVLQESGLLEEVLRQIIRARLPGTAPFAGLEEKAGGSAALWQTIRDLKDGGVDPATALEAARGDLFEESTEGVEALLTLYQVFLAGLQKWGLRDYADLDALALEHAPTSNYLQSFKRVLYYGFYDLTQVQLDVFLAVARRYPTTVFFPLIHDRPKHPAWTFAERFYERYIHGVADRQAEIRNLVAAEGSATRPSLLSLFAEEAGAARPAALKDFPIRIFSCFSARDEIDAAAKEILRLHTEEGCSFDEIGVVGRSLEPYLSSIRDVFSRHAVPFSTSGEEPLASHPLAKAALLLVNLPLKGYVRSHVIDLLDSPFFNAPACDKNLSPRPDLWDLASRRLAIGKGADEWLRMEKYAARGITVAETADNEDVKRREIAVPPEQLRALLKIFTALRADFEALPGEASWSRYAVVWEALQQKWLAPDRDSAAAESIGGTLRRLGELDAVGEKVTLAHFLETYQRWIERGSIAGNASLGGVAVLDAMAARGLSFRALFIIGLNEGVFPRTIREDAFLRDRERELLETVLGYKVATKLGGFDEERLLFTLLVGAAKERLYCLYARNDGDGRPLAASWYVDELCRAVGRDYVVRATIPRGEAEKAALPPFDRPELLPPEELAIRLTLTAKDPQAIIDLCLPAPSLYVRGRAALERLETFAETLADHDGIVGPLPDYWRRVGAKGLSPSSLESYARCPFQFFAHHLLGLERLERPEEIDGPGAADMGQIVHEILRAFYQELIERGFFEPDRSELKRDFLPLLQAATQKTFSAFERDNPVGYPLAWEIAKENLAALVSAVVARDLETIEASGYRPRATEESALAKLPEDWPAPLSGLMIRGRMDRIDYNAEEKRFRVVDYKLKSQKSRPAVDKDLLRSALRAQRLQPPLYAVLGQTAAASSGFPDAAVEVAFYYLAPAWRDGPLTIETMDSDVWRGPSGAALKETVAFLVESMRRGLFFIQPNDLCRFCDVSEACRRHHRPTLWRAEGDAACQTHLALKKKEVAPCP